MNCPSCGAPLPNDARFCYACGRPTTAAPSPPGATGAGTAPPPPPAPPPPAAAPTPPPVAPMGAKEIKCPACGAPIQPVFGEMVVSCEYCGASVTLGGAGWKEINKHSMLAVKLAQPADALRVVHDLLDQGLFHHHAFEESTVTEQKLTFVPFWVIPSSANTTFQYQDVAVGVGGTVATVAAGEMLGAALNRGRGGGFMPFPVVMGPPVNPTRSDTISGMYEYPVVAVKGMSAYQPKDYQFALPDRSFFDKKQVPPSAQVLNGDLGEDAAQHAAKSYVAQLQAEAAHKKHHMVSKLETSVEVSEGELLHVPIWSVTLDRKGQRVLVLVDAHAARVIQTMNA